MGRLKKQNNSNLSECETLIMKAIWDAKEDICVGDLTEVLRVRFGKDYAAQTVRTFLIDLSEKGYIETYRKGKLSYAHVLKSEEKYRQKLLREEMEFWDQGRPAKLVAALSNASKFSKEDLEEIRRIIDALDD